MANRRSILAACGIGLAMALPGMVSAQAPQDSAFIAAGAAVEAPRGFVEMCRAEASFCSGEMPGPGTMLVTGAVTLAPPAASSVPNEQPETVRLRQVNLLVNRRVRQVTDAEQFGREEYWRRPGLARGAAGDCEDIAIEKRHQLIEAGVDPGTLRFAVVYAPRIGAHVVLVARTGAGDMVLDSLTPLVRRWSDTGYLWVSIQSAEQPDRWTLVKRPQAPVVTAAQPITDRAG